MQLKADVSSLHCMKCVLNGSPPTCYPSCSPASIVKYQVSTSSCVLLKSNVFVMQRAIEQGFILKPPKGHC